MQSSKDLDLPFSLYITIEEDSNAKGLINKALIMKSMAKTLPVVGQWRIIQTCCGAIVSFSHEEDLYTFTADFESVISPSAYYYIFSSLETFRQKMVIQNIPIMINEKEMESALKRQGVIPLSISRTRQGDFVIEVGQAKDVINLSQNGFNLYGTALFPCAIFSNYNPMPPPLRLPTKPLVSTQYSDSVLQCYKCQGFWHFAAQCENIQRCVRCGDNHYVKDCPRPRDDPICLHCSGPHHAAYKMCPVRLQMKGYALYPPLYYPTFYPATPYSY